MSKGQVQLSVVVRADWIGEHYLPETAVEETITLSIPLMEEKFVVFPKVMEGVTFAVVETHRRKVGAALAVLDKEKSEWGRLKKWSQETMPIVENEDIDSTE